MKTRTIGESGLTVSQIGFGAWGIGGAYYGDVSDEDAIAAVRTYLDAGGNHLDTAYSYQKSEELVGRAIKGYDRDKIVIASKTFAGLRGIGEIPEIRKELEVSLRGLGVDYLDIYMIHGSPADPDVMAAICDEFEALREEGLIRLIGASIPGPVVTDDRVARARQYIRSGRIDLLQVNYSIARQKLGEMFAEAEEKGVGIFCRWVYESGMLTGKYPPGHEFIWPDTRNRYTPEERDGILKIGQELKGKLPPGYDNPAQAAAAFALATPHVTGIVLGATGPDQVRRNCAIDNLPPIPEQLFEELVATYGPLNDQYNPTREYEHVDGRLGASVK